MKRSGFHLALLALLALLFEASTMPTSGSRTAAVRSFVRRVVPGLGVSKPALAPLPPSSALIHWSSPRTTKKRKRGEQPGSRIAAYCFCGEIDAESLAETTIAQEGRVWSSAPFDDVIHLSASTSSVDGDDESDSPMGSDIFVMTYGCVVFWNLRPDEELSFIELLKPFSTQLLEKLEFDFLTLAKQEKDGAPQLRAQLSKVSGEIVTLQTLEPAEKLAISFALAQSSKLSVLEQQLDACLDEVRHIPEEMSRTGAVRFSEREVSQMTGKLFLFRSELNLYSDILDGQPLWFWDNEDFAPQYESAAKYLDIDHRVDVYNQRLDIVGELVDNLNDRLNHRHSSKLEWIIIWLISVEIVLSLMPHGNVVGMLPRMMRLLRIPVPL